MAFFISYSCVVYDRMLNTIQVDTQFKSVRCQKLPVLADYFDEFYLVHCEAVSTF